MTDHRRLSIRIHAQPPATKGCDCDRRYIAVVRFGALELRVKMNPAERLDLLENLIGGNGEIGLRAEMEPVQAIIEGHERFKHRGAHFVTINADDLGAERLPLLEGGPTKEREE